MALTSLVLELEAADAVALSDALLEAGALSVSAEDAQAGTPAEVPLYDEFGTELPDPSMWPLLRGHFPAVRACGSSLTGSAMIHGRFRSTVSRHAA